MPSSPIISLIMPTRGRVAKVQQCISALTRQTGVAWTEYEILIGLDGADPETESAVTAFTADNADLQIRCWAFPQRGIAQIKNELIERAAGKLLLFINDDVIPAPDFVSQHVASHRTDHSVRDPDDADTESAGQMVLGDSPFLLPGLPERTFFDELLARTSMIFFYDQMPGARLGMTRDDLSQCFAVHRPFINQSELASGRQRDWGFRHAWNLNLSVPKSLVEEVGGFNAGIANCCFEDVELAGRIANALDAPVIFNPNAIAVHDHRMSPDDYLAREYRLGYAAFGFARLAPEGAAAVFGHDPASQEALAYAAQFVAVEGRRENALRALFASFADWPADAQIASASRTSEDLVTAAAIEDSIDAGIDVHEGPDPRLLRIAYEQHLPLKRLIFHRGLLDAAAGRKIAGLYHPDDSKAVCPATTR